MPRGGNKTQPIESCWNSMLPSWTAPAGVNYDGRAPLLRASNSRVFASVTSASPYSLPLRRAGLLLLSRHLCLDGKKSNVTPYQSCHFFSSSCSLHALRSYFLSFALLTGYTS